MPGLTGFQIAAALRDDPATASIPVVFLTAKQQMEDVLAGAKLGAKSYVVKPFKSSDLVWRVEAAIDDPSAS